jgi:hypothetical protein
LNPYERDVNLIVSGIEVEKENKMTELKRLNEASIKAQEALDHANKVMDEEIRQASETIRAKYRDILRPLITANNEARIAYIAERDRAAIEEANPPYPVGTKVYEWIRLEWPNHDQPKKLSGRVGLIEVWTRDSKKPDSVGLGPYVGRVVVRFLKKDGTPSLKYEEREISKWLPEGVKPKGAK